jgi:hypothetical protein
MNTQMPIWADEESLGARIGRHRAGWGAEQRAMIERERLREHAIIPLAEIAAYRAECDRDDAYRVDPERAAAAHVELMPRRYAAIPGHTETVSDPSYEPSVPAPSRHGWLFIGLLLAGAAMTWAAWRRLRVESRIALFALALAGTALLMGWPR